MFSSRGLSQNWDRWVRCGETGSRWDSHGYAGTATTVETVVGTATTTTTTSKAQSLSQPDTGIILTIVHHLHTALVTVVTLTPGYSLSLPVDPRWPGSRAPSSGWWDWRTPETGLTVWQETETTTFSTGKLGRKTIIWKVSAVKLSNLTNRSEFCAKGKH